jgi:hypothetical protein
LVVAQVHPKALSQLDFARKSTGENILIMRIEFERKAKLSKTVLPDGRSDAGRAALRAVLGFARCSPVLAAPRLAIESSLQSLN